MKTIILHKDPSKTVWIYGHRTTKHRRLLGTCQHLMLSAWGTCYDGRHGLLAAAHIYVMGGVIRDATWHHYTPIGEVAKTADTGFWAMLAGHLGAMAGIRGASRGFRPAVLSTAGDLRGS